MERDKHGMSPKWNLTKIECDQNGMWPKLNVTKMENAQMEYDQNGICSNGMWVYLIYFGQFPFWSHSNLVIFHLSTLLFGHIPFWSHSILVTFHLNIFHFGHIPFWSHSILVTFHLSKFHFGHVPFEHFWYWKASLNQPDKNYQSPISHVLAPDLIIAIGLALSNSSAIHALDGN